MVGERFDYLDRVGSHVCEGGVEDDQPHILPAHSLLVTFQAGRVNFLAPRSPPDVGGIVGRVSLNLQTVVGVFSPIYCNIIKKTVQWNWKMDVVNMVMKQINMVKRVQSIKSLHVF